MNCVCCEHGQETLKTDAFLNLKVKSKSLVTSATSGTSRDFWKNDDDERLKSVSISLLTSGAEGDFR